MRCKKTKVKVRKTKKKILRIIRKTFENIGTPIAKAKGII